VLTAVRPPQQHARPTVRAPRVSAALLMMAALAGCSHAISVNVPVPSLGTAVSDTAVKDRCSAVTATLPQTLGKASKVNASPASALTAAWADGDKAVTLTCGLPVAHTPTESLITVDGVAWRVQKHTDGTQFTAVDRVVAVTLTVPTAAMPAAAYLSGLALPIAVAAPAK